LLSVKLLLTPQPPHIYLQLLLGWIHENFLQKKSLHLSMFSFDRCTISSANNSALLNWSVSITSDVVVSSTYFYKLVLFADKSFIIIKKSLGPNFIPRGTSKGTYPHSKKQQCTSFTLWNLSHRKSIIQFIMLLGIGLGFSDKNFIVNKVKRFFVVK
jgi:hypothetical protein